MRWISLAAVLVLLAGCGGVSDYSADRGSKTSLTGNQGGTGVQANIWSTDPAKKTLINPKDTP